MKQLILLALLIPYSSLFHLNAQSISAYKVSLNEEKIATTHFTKSKYYLKSFKNNGTQENKTLEETVNNYLKKYHWPLDEQKPWIKQPFILPVKNESDADIILSGTYKYTSQTTEGEAVYTENRGNHGLPYFVTSATNKADLLVIFTFKYKDGSPSQTDTFAIAQKSVKTPGKSYTPLDILEKQVTSYVVDKIKYYNSNIKSSKKAAFNFPKIKFKDKALKLKYASIKDLYKKRNYIDAAKVIKELYDKQPSPELAYALALSYELIGNFPKAAEYYKIKTDFHANVRMKKNMALLNYAKNIGYEPTFIEL
ncbi:MAG: tetratricopeptide repeat protein [Carboxylicivirga sp.]|jgi:hypothetical protein|nr:tetratricopeptide repeat protein [Carboxylicivirga sp.]